MTQRSRKGFSVAKRIATVVVSMLCFAFGLTACGGSGVNGTYYLYQNGSLDRSQYVTINGGNWTDDDGETGEVKISGETITLYVEFFGEKEEFASGTVKNGVLTLRIMGAEIVYCQEGKTPTDGSKDDDKTPTAQTYTITYNANGGVFPDGTNQLTQTVSGNTLLTAPTSPEKDQYAFAGWGKSNSDDVLWDFATEKVTSDMTLYAKWTKSLKFVLSEDKSYYIVDGIGLLSGEIVIPETHNGKPVSEIAEEAFRKERGLTSIVIPDSVKTIGESAFFECSNLTNAVLGENVTAVEKDMFKNCSKLTSVTIPASVKNIKWGAFSGCETLIDIYYTGTASGWAEIDFDYSASSTTLETANPLSYYSVENFYIDDKLVTELNIDTASEIKPTAFLNYKKLTTVEIGNGVTNIGNYAFFGCSSLTNVMVENSVTNIGSYAFYRCRSLTSVTLGSGVTRIEDHAFSSCDSLTSITIPDRVTFIGEEAFGLCEKLQKVTLGNSVMEIGAYAFYMCEAVTSITIPSSVLYIGEQAFYGSGLTSLKFGSTSGWCALKDGGNESISSSDISNPSTAAKLITTSILAKGYGDVAWERETLVYTLSSDKTYYTVTNRGTTTRESITIPGKYNGKPVKEIEYTAFKDCETLFSIHLPGSITSIRTGAFYNCSRLTSVTIGNGVTSIGNSAFSGCSSLTSITIPDSVTSIGWFAFSGCYKLVEVINKSTLEISKGSEENGDVAYYALYVHNGTSKIVN